MKPSSSSSSINLRRRDLKRKCRDTSTVENRRNDWERPEKQLRNECASGTKLSVSNNSNLNLDTNNTSTTATDLPYHNTGFFDDYCQILLKDTATNNITRDTDILTETNEIFNSVPQHHQPKVPLSVKLKIWATKNSTSLNNSTIDELLSILKDEGYLDLPSTAENLLANNEDYGQSECSVVDVDLQKTTTTDPSVIWIKKEDQESLWNKQTSENETNTNDSSCGESYDGELIRKGRRSRVNSLSTVCPDFSVTDFFNEETDTAGARTRSDDGSNITNVNDTTKSNNRDKENDLNFDLSHSKLYSILKDELQEMEQRWSRQLQSTKRSLLYDIVRKYEDLKNRIGTSTRTLGTGFTDDKEILGVKLPFNNVETFCEFDASIADNPEREIAMKSLMTSLCFGAGSLSASIGCILSAFLTKDLQMQYSACGKKIRGIKKRNFGDTFTFKYAKDVLRDKHGTGDAEIISKTSRWFTGAGDRDGGRKERRSK